MKILLVISTPLCTMPFQSVGGPICNDLFYLGTKSQPQKLKFLKSIEYSGEVDLQSSHKLDQILQKVKESRTIEYPM